jgi:hypothetical protein
MGFNRDNVVRADNTFLFGPMTNLPVIDREGFALYEATEKAWARYTVSTACTKDVALQGIRLAPVGGPPDLSTAKIFSVDNTGGSAYPIDAPDTGRGQHVCWSDARAAADGTITSRTLWTANPTVVLSLKRCAQPPGGSSAPQTFALRWGATDVWDGAPFRLTFGGYTPPRLYLDFHEELGGPQLLAEYEHALGGRDGYTFSPEVWLYCFPIPQGQTGGYLVFQGTLFPEPWYVRVNAMPGPAPWSFRGRGGSWSANVYQERYQTTGTFTTDDREHYADFAEVSLDARIYPTAQRGSAFSALAIDGPGWSRHYEFTLTGDGFHTPLVCAWQAIYEPMISTAPQKWYDGSGYFVEGTDTLPYEVSGRTLALTLQNQGGDRAYDDNFTHWLEARNLHAGQFLVKYSIGYRLRDGSSDPRPRGTLICKVRERDEPLRGRENYLLTAYDRAAMFADRKMDNAPVGQGMLLGDYLRLVLQWGGVPLSQQYINADLDAPHLVLDDPGANYGAPAWAPNDDTTVASYLQQLAEAFHLRMYWGVDDCFYVQPWYFENPAGIITYNSATGVNIAVSMRDLSAQTDLTGDAGANGVKVTGRDGWGNPVVAVFLPHETPGTPGYLGYRALQPVKQENITSLDHARSVAYAAYQRLTNGLTRVRMTGQFSLLDQWPHNIFELLDHYTGQHGPPVRYRVVSLTTRLGLTVNEATLEGIEVRET